MSDSKHGEPKKAGNWSGSPIDWEVMMTNNMEALEKARDHYEISAEASADVARIAREHFSRMMEDLQDSPNQWDTTSQEKYRGFARRYSRMVDEMLGTPSVLRFYAKNLDAFLDWKILLQDAQDQLLKSMGLVTGGKLSEIRKEMYELKKQVEEMSKSTEKEGESHLGSRKG
jgi:hypothetical protein